MNSVWMLCIETEYNYLNELINDIYAFESKKDAEAYRQYIIDCCTVDAMEWFECDENHLYSFIMDVQKSEIFNTTYIEIEDTISTYLEVKELPIMKFEEE